VDGLGLLQVADPGGAGVLPVEVDGPAGQCQPGVVRTLDVRLVDRGCARGLQRHHRDLTEQELLIEVLRADLELGVLERVDLWIDPLLTPSPTLSLLTVQPDTARLATARTAVSGASR